MLQIAPVEVLAHTGSPQGELVATKDIRTQVTGTIFIPLKKTLSLYPLPGGSDLQRFWGEKNLGENRKLLVLKEIKFFKILILPLPHGPFLQHFWRVFGIKWAGQKRAQR